LGLGGLTILRNKAEIYEGPSGVSLYMLPKTRTGGPREQRAAFMIPETRFCRGEGKYGLERSVNGKVQPLITRGYSFLRKKKGGKVTWKE